MKYFSQILIVLFIVSCAQNEKVNNNELSNQKEAITKQIDSLSKELKRIEGQLSKLDTTQKKQRVTVGMIKKSNFLHYIEIQGLVKSSQNVTLNSELGGVAKQIFVKEGAQVKKGTVLVQFNDETLQHTIDEINVQLKLAKTTFERQQNLWNQKIGSEITYLSTKTQKEALEEKLKSLESQKDKLKIRAPFNGTVDEVFPKIGELYSPQMPVVRFINLEDVYIEAEITESYLKTIKKGTPVEVYIPVLQQKIEAKISQVGNFINPNSRSFKVKIKIDNKNEQIKPNLLTDIKVVDFQSVGITVPTRLIQQDRKGDDFVLTVEKKEDAYTVVKNKVKVINEYNNKVLISEGLTESNSLIVEGERIVKEGDKVQVSKN